MTGYSSNPSDLESRLGRLLAGEPTRDLRQRVMRAVDAELAGNRPSACGKAGWYWPAIAAAVLIVMNLSFVSASRDAFSLPPTPGRQDMAAELHALQTFTAQQEGLFK